MAFARFGVNDRVTLVVEAMRRGVLPPEGREEPAGGTYRPRWNSQICSRPSSG